VSTANLSAEASVSRANQAAAVLRGSRSQRDKTVVVAPINGIIAEIPSKVGTFAVAGLSTTALMTIADMSTVNVEVKVDETEIDKVEVGQAVKVKVDALGENEIVGEVRQKTPLAVGKSQTSGGLSVNINVQEAKNFALSSSLMNLSDETRSSLRPGMSATAVITTKTAENVVAVPLQAVIEKKPERRAFARKLAAKRSSRRPPTNLNRSKAFTFWTAIKRNSSKSKPASPANPTCRLPADFPKVRK
jgi:HlyD family secretion protein